MRVFFRIKVGIDKWQDANGRKRVAWYKKGKRRLRAAKDKGKDLCKSSGR